ncbi:MAG: PilZ domain-containing protein [Fibrobacteres bacterium]|nr:PilZ domain-containing protein [Fibrobacterota bacterium]
MRYTALLVASIFAYADARYIYKDVKWKVAGTQEIILFCVLLALFILALVFIPKWLSKRNRKLQHTFASSALQDEFQKLKLTKEDILLLRKIVGTGDTDALLLELLQSRIKFEEEIHEYLERKENKKSETGEHIGRIRLKLGFNTYPPDFPLQATRSITKDISGALFTVPQGTSPLIKRVKVSNCNELFFELEASPEDCSLVSEGVKYQFVFTRRGDAMYTAEVKLLSKTFEPRLQFTHSVAMIRRQSRKYARVNVNIPLQAVPVLIKGEMIAKDNVSPFPVTITDISGGGSSFICETPLARNDRIVLSFPENSKSILSLKANVLRDEAIEGSTDQKMKYHSEFVDIDDRTREKLIKFVLDRQMRQKKIS